MTVKVLSIHVDAKMHHALVFRLNSLRAEILSRKLPDSGTHYRDYRREAERQMKELSALTMRSLCVALMALGFGRPTELLAYMVQEARPRGRPYDAEEPFDKQALGPAGLEPSPLMRAAKPAPAKPAKPKTARQLAREAKKRAQDAEDRRLSQEARDNLPEFLRD